MPYRFFENPVSIEKIGHRGGKRTRPSLFIDTIAGLSYEEKAIFPFSVVNLGGRETVVIDRTRPFTFEEEARLSELGGGFKENNLG